MFDWVKCEVPLPDGWVHPEFQTKDFPDPYLDTYTIRADGRLIRRAVGSEEADLNFHGHFRFYSYEGDVNAANPITDRWHEYRAKFTDGQLVGIEVVPEHEHT